MKVINSFYETDFSEHERELEKVLARALTAKGKEYLLSVDAGQFKEYLTQLLHIEPLVVDRSTEFVGRPYVTTESYRDPFGRDMRAEYYNIPVTYSFTGSWELFRLKPSTMALISVRIEVDELKYLVSFTVKQRGTDSGEFERAKSGTFEHAFANLEGVNLDAKDWNRRLAGLIDSRFNSLRAKYLEENTFFEAINVKHNPTTTTIFAVPAIQKKIIPPPTSETKRFSSEPMIAKEMYEDVLKVIYEAGKNMEKKPALYREKDEEGLRDQFLFILETRYEGTTATGETFNKGGKTDIILKFARDGSNLFVAECKFWHGPAEFLKAISQLFDRYLTWRDSKTALLLFVTNESFTKVLGTVRQDIKRHPYYKRDNGARGESSLSYVFGLPQDLHKDVYLEIILLHFDK